MALLEFLARHFLSITRLVWPFGRYLPRHWADTTTPGFHRPHTLPPQSLYLAHLAPYLASTQAQLETQLQTVQAENAQLAQGVETQRDEVEWLVSGLEAVIADLEGANVVMGEVINGGEMRQEAMEVETEIGGRSRESRL